MTSFTVDDLQPFLGGQVTVVGSAAGKRFDSVKPIADADENSLVWINPTRSDQRHLAESTQAQIIICATSLDVSGLGPKCFLQVPDPKLAIIRIVEALFAVGVPSGIDPTAVISPKAQIHPAASIGAFVWVGEAVVGAGSVIQSHCHIGDMVTIGRDVLIRPGCVIGGEGYNFGREPDGRLVRFPHIGGVVIEDDVEIQALTNIDRGVLGSTLIRRGAKIDSLVHIAHNVEIGEDASVIALSMVGGSTVVGARSWIAPSATLRDVLRIGDDAVVGLGAVVVKDVPARATVAGNPARPIDEQRRILARLRELGSIDGD